MRRILISSIVLVLLVGGGILGVSRINASPRFEDRTDPVLGNLVEGIATRDALWVRGSSGKIVRINRATGERSLLTEGTIDILANGQHLWALAKRPDDAWQVFDLRNRNGPAIRVTQDSKPIALFSTSAGPAVLASNKVLLSSQGDWKTLPLSETFSERATIFSPSDNVLYVGYDHGEFGGGLRRIDLNNGDISLIDDSEPDKLCTGLMNTRCDPIVGIVAAPEQPDCVLAGTSLQHLGMKIGRIVMACEQSLTPVFSRKLWSPLSTLERLLSDHSQTWTFNSLVAAPNGWVASGDTRYARATHSASATAPKVKMSAYPRLKALGGLNVSEEIDSVIFAEAHCCLHYDLYTQRVMIALPVTD